ncbi:MAG TPA: Abi-alpha family protein [Pseudonocardia sp.]
MTVERRPVDRPATRPRAVDPDPNLSPAVAPTRRPAVAQPRRPDVVPAMNGEAPHGLRATLADAANGLLAGVSPTAAVQALPDMAKIAGSVLWRTNRWTLNASLHIGNIVIRGAVSGQSAQSLIEEISTEAKHSLREILGVSDPDPMPKALRARIIPNGSSTATPEITLPDRMAALLDASADLDYSDAGHPAYVRLLSELAPDEARILRLFAQRGAQAAVDVRTRRPFGVGSELIAPGITMIGRYAGCRHVDRVPAYLNNLFRLGLVWFSREAIPEQSVYDVLEAQDEVAEAMARAGRGVTVRRSIELTAFGRNLCARTGLLPPADEIATASNNESTRQLPPPDAR